MFAMTHIAMKWVSGETGLTLFTPINVFERRAQDFKNLETNKSVSGRK